MTLLAGVAVLGLALPAQAQRAGSYRVEGIEASDGNPYSGSVELAATGPETWHATWRIGGQVTQGIGILVNGVLAFGYFGQGATGTALYVVAADGSLAGRWTWGLNGRVGTERWLPR
jgi:hypothetical protein